MGPSGNQAGMGALDMEAAMEAAAAMAVADLPADSLGVPSLDRWVNLGKLARTDMRGA